jgi:hypothetical protein
MKYFLSVEFEDQGVPSTYKTGDIITFVSMKGYLKNGIVKEIKYMKDYPTIATDYIVDCQGKDFIAGSDYVLKRNAKVLNLKTSIEELNQGFPLRT